MPHLLTRSATTAALAALLLLPLASWAQGTTLAGTIRDFNADGVNFEGNGGGVVQGMVEATLTGPSPTLTALGRSQIEPTNFAQWFTKASDSVSFALTLSETSPGSGTFAYSNTNFFPIDGQLLGNQGQPHNYHFTYSIASNFEYIPGAGQTFSFTGDDDVWVFFDKKLGIDLGGVHRASSASVNLDTLLAGRPRGSYSFDFFFAERHTTESNLAISTTIALVPETASSLLLSLGLLALAGHSARRRGNLQRKHPAA